MHYIIAYFAAIIVFFIIDFVWIGTIAREFYKNQIGHLRGVEVNVPAAIMFYLMYIAGIMIFAVKPALVSGSIKPALIYGALFGFFCYATYDFTNYATLKNWPLKMVVVDITWGIFLTGSVAMAAAWVALKFV
ncbi:MAG: DUF2177 family protein [Maricaulaceae bacterium]